MVLGHSYQRHNPWWLENQRDHNRQRGHRRLGLRPKPRHKDLHISRPLSQYLHLQLCRFHRLKRSPEPQFSRQSQQEHPNQRSQWWLIGRPIRIEPILPLILLGCEGLLFTTDQWQWWYDYIEWVFVESVGLAERVLGWYWG